jgi:murein DD-endopeptidase MepM/ murein hydrolase activator NlpD
LVPRIFKQKIPLLSWTVGGLVIAGLIGFGLSVRTSDEKIPPPTSDIATTVTPPLPGDTVTGPAPIFLPPRPPADIEKTMTVGNGDTFMAVMIKAGATGQDAHLAIESMRKLFNPRKLRRNQIITVIFRPATRTATTGRLVGLHFDPTVEQIIRVSLTDDRYTAEAHKRILDVQDAVVSGTIKSSLYMAAIKVGLPPAVLVKLIRLLSWDVDFQRDIQKGDRFTVLTERLHHKDGRIARWGDIQHAELVLSGKPVRIYRYKTKRHGVEYFDEKGRSAQKALMKTPIDGARLSSRFGRRKHPILGYTRMHKGIDFAAPRGTPIYAAGNGTVTYAGRKGGYGKYVQIRHNGTFETAYAHMKGFGRGVRRGRRVRQGQIIGYVGSTGRSTGPHLHYEVRRGGRQVNPLRIKLPSGRKLAGAELKRFTRFRSQLDTRLAAVPSKTRYADATR